MLLGWHLVHFLWIQVVLGCLHQRFHCWLCQAVENQEAEHHLLQELCCQKVHCLRCLESCRSLSSPKNQESVLVGWHPLHFLWIPVVLGCLH